jgi:antitoxin MazE
MTKIRIVKSGNSTAIRLSKAVLNKLDLRQGDIVELTVQDGKAVLESIRQSERPKKITLEWIISEMKRLGPENSPRRSNGAPTSAAKSSMTNIRAAR